jgi:hypothetical protein
MEWKHFAIVAAVLTVCLVVTAVLAVKGIIVGAAAMGIVGTIVGFFTGAVTPAPGSGGK